MSKHVLTQAASYLDIRRLKLVSVTEVKQQSSGLSKQASVPSLHICLGLVAVSWWLSCWQAGLLTDLFHKLDQGWLSITLQCGVRKALSLDEGYHCIKLQLCDSFLCCHQAASKTCQALNPSQDGCWLFVLRLPDVRIVKLNLGSFGWRSLLLVLRSSTFSFLTHHTPRLERYVGHIVKLPFLLWWLLWLPKILGMKACCVRLSPCICNLFFARHKIKARINFKLSCSTCCLVGSSSRSGLEEEDLEADFWVWSSLSAGRKPITCDKLPKKKLDKPCWDGQAIR